MSNIVQMSLRNVLSPLFKFVALLLGGDFQLTDGFDCVVELVNYSYDLFTLVAHAAVAMAALAIAVLAPTALVSYPSRVVRAMVYRTRRAFFVCSHVLPEVVPHEHFDGRHRFNYEGL